MANSHNTKFDQPICIAVVLCNEVIEDKRTNNKSLIGLFNTIATLDVPARHPRMCVMASLTNIRGKVPINFSFRSPNMQEITRLNGELQSSDPMAVVDIVVEMVDFPLPELGAYFIDVLLGEAPIGSRRFTVKKMGENHAGDYPG